MIFRKTALFKTLILAFVLMLPLLETASASTRARERYTHDNNFYGVNQQELATWLAGKRSEISDNGFTSDNIQTAYDNNLFPVGLRYTVNGKTYIQVPTGTKPNNPTDGYIYQTPTEFKDGLGHLNVAQRAELYHKCAAKAITARTGFQQCTVIASGTSDIKEQVQKDLRQQAYAREGGMALRLFKYAMGQQEGTDNTCITCTFLSAFLTALSGFSASVFLFFRGAFVVFVPILISIWIAWKASALFLVGGEDGRSFIYAILGRMALFFMLWAAFSTGEETHTDGAGTYTTLAYGWEMTGPTYLNFAFGISDEIRRQTFDAETSVASNFNPGKHSSAFQCNYTIKELQTASSMPQIDEFKAHALNVACATERAHMVGISTGLAVMNSAKHDLDLDLDKLGSALVKLVTGLFLMVIFGLSAVWFIFLILDIAVRGLITAAFAPLIAALALFKPTRYIAINAIKSMGGAVMTAVGIGIVSTLAFFLLTNVVNVYNDLIPAYQKIYDNVTLEEISMTNSVEAYEEFIVRVQSTNTDFAQIPMDLTSPWFYYLVLSGLAIFSLGKKIIAMLEGLIGVGGMSAMADNAMRMTQTGLGLGMQAATALGVGSMAAGKTLSGFGAQAGGAAAGAGDAASNLANSVNPFPADSGKALVNSINGE
jgi:hypothetical protein